MPMRVCSVCNQLQKYSKDEYSYLDKDGPLVCSAECVRRWVRTAEVSTPSPLNLNTTREDRKVGLVKVERADEAYSVRLKMWFRGWFELSVAEALEKWGVYFEYEEFGFSWGPKSYTPDFYLPIDKSFLEVKGVWQASQRSKYADFRREWPEIRLLVVPWILSKEFLDMRGEII